MRRSRNLPLVIFTALLLAVSGCTTTTNRTTSLSKEQAVDDRVRLGLAYIKEGKRQRARQNILQALEIDSRSAKAHDAMALLLQLEMEYELAEKYYKKAISYDKRFTRARNNYAVFLYNQKRYEDAYTQFSKASEDVDYRNRHQVFFSLGVVAGKVGKSDEARDAWRKALVLVPRYAAPYLELAESYFDQGDIENARKHLDAFDKLSRPQSRSLWLAVRIADYLGDKDALASKGLALTKLFPNSDENRQYQAWLKNE